HGGNSRLLVRCHGALGRHHVPGDQSALRPIKFQPTEPAKDFLCHFARNDTHGEFLNRAIK
ncbi:hypothetical protein NPIL_626241, partial [Nephila pilipes]